MNDDAAADPADDSDRAKVASLMDGIKFAMLITIDDEGSFVGRPMAHQDVEFDGDLWFVSSRTARKVHQINANPHVAVMLSSSDSWVSISGRAETVDDPAKLEDVWSTDMEAWFPGGPDLESVTLIKVSGESAEYWDGPGGRVSTALSLVKAKLTGKRYTGGDNAAVELEQAD